MRISIKTTSQGEFIIKSAFVNFGERAEEVYFKFPITCAQDITEFADPFAYALIFLMMQRGGGEVYIDSPITLSTMRNVERLSRLWSSWKPDRYKSITIKAEVAKDSLNPSDKLITAFSGGLDASYTAYKYKHNLDDIYKLEYDKSIMIFGADIPLSDPDAFDRAFAVAKTMLDDLGVEIIPIETNVRDYLNSWEDSFGSVVIGCLSFFSKAYGYGAASDSSIMNYHIPWGMNPITDQLFSSPLFYFISDGWDHSRTERAALVRNWEVGLNNLRVCWENKDTSKNCGCCEKCIRTKLNFKAVGVDHMPSMPTDLSLTDFDNNKLVSSEHILTFYKEACEYGKAHKTLDDEWIRVLERQITKWERTIRLKKFRKNLKKRLKGMVGPLF